MPADTATRDRRDLLTTPDALQQAAQAQSWLYMSASLENSYAATERSAAAALEQQRTELSAQEADIADARVRFDAERLVSFYQELLTPEVHYCSPETMTSKLTSEIGGRRDYIFGASLSDARRSMLADAGWSTGSRRETGQ